MGHRDFKTTLIYANYQPSEREAEFVERAFTLLASAALAMGATASPDRAS